MGDTTSILNLAGSSYDFGNVLFAVLQECEHRRRSFVDDDVEEHLMRTAREKLEQIRASYLEAGGTAGYWSSVEREVLQTAMPQYIRTAREKNVQERTGYGIWRDADLVARSLFALIGLTIGGIIIAVPFIPIFWKPFAFILAAAGWFYPELKSTMGEYRHARILNKLVATAEKYQKNYRIHYISNAHFDEVLSVPASLERPADPPKLSESKRNVKLVEK